MAGYEIRVKGHLEQGWEEWFGGLEITNLEGGEAVISGELPDQAALHGVLNKVRDLGLPLVGITSNAPDQKESPIRPGKHYGRGDGDTEPAADPSVTSGAQAIKKDPG